MSGCRNLSSYKLSNKNNIVNEEHHSPNPLNNNNIIINNKNTSLRRTLSADMSSQKWVQNNGFSLIKRVHSSENLQSLEEENHYNNEEILNDNKRISSGGAAFEDIWSSILSEKKLVEAGSGDPAPYVHPLVKRASSLSEKSLEICTESLGSETGSDGFSNPLSDPGDGQEEEEVHEDEEEVVRKNGKVFVEVVTNKYSYPINNKKINVGVERSFPPPLPSLVNHMRTRRHKGRVVVEAVSVASQNCFRAQREDGRLLLTFTNDNNAEPEQKQEQEQNSDDEAEKVDELSTLPRATGVINVTRRAPEAMLMRKIIELTGTRSKSTWPRASNMTIVKSLREDEEDILKDLVEVELARRKIFAHSLPPRPRVNTAVSAATILNAYEYYWRRSDSPTAAAVAVLKPLAGKQNNCSNDSVFPQVVKGDNKRVNKFLLGNNEKGRAQDKVVLVGEETNGDKGEYLVPLFRGCKDPKRSLFFWEPYCIATS
ncbi:hypothetical protein RND81_01G054200 [Saponaria officinalis]|uniref:FAF domain-containing protein n=1 Tax=Saponaria officinalis TaxID=3572 RepID=A0AAW1NCN9_SAPOF